MKRITKITAAIIAVFAVGICLAGVTGSFRETPSAAYAAVLQQGSRGGDVTAMQKKLKNWGYYDGAIDGIYGSKTRKAVVYFQKKNGLAADSRSPRLVFAPQAGNIVIENAVQVDGMDEHGLKYSFNGELKNDQVAILATCLFIERQAGQGSAIEMMKELDEFQRELDAGFVITI